MGFIQLNEDFIFIEPLNDTVAITGHPHRVYRQKRSMQEKVTEKPTPHSHYCGIISGNALWKISLTIQCGGQGEQYEIDPSKILSIHPSIHLLALSFSFG